jgi:hypothetical protein
MSRGGGVFDGFRAVPRSAIGAFCRRLRACSDLRLPGQAVMKFGWVRPREAVQGYAAS